MVYAKNNPLQVGLPRSAKLSNGTWVSNYHLLPEETLREEGWLPLEEVIPQYNEETHYLEQDTVAEVDGRLVITYKAVELPPDPIDLLLEELEAEL